MTDDQINDLTHFFVVAVQQATVGLATRDEMNQRFNDIQSTIADAISTVSDVAAQQRNNHEHRIQSLEARIA